MSESNPMLQLSTAPSAPEPEAPAAVTESIQQTAAPAEPEAAPRLDDSQLTEAEKKSDRRFHHQGGHRQPGSRIALRCRRAKKDRRFLADRP